MSKAFMGVRVRRLREERGLSQIALARVLEISPSYLNQIERNQRPMTIAILLKINASFGVDVQLFSDDDESKLIADLRDAFSESGESIATVELRELAANMPEVGRAIVSLHRRARDAVERCDVLASELGDDRRTTSASIRMPFEEARDFFSARQNYVDELERRAEWTHRDAGLVDGDLAAGLRGRLYERHAVRVTTDPDAGGKIETLRSFDRRARELRLSPHLGPGQQAFQMAQQLAFLESGDLLHELAEAGNLSGREASSLVRIGLASYFAGAVLMPYAEFLAAAERHRYDIELLGRTFGVGYETTCHRLSTLQRPNARGVPFFFVRVDRAGNVSKRQSATDFHFSRVGGTCPLWNVYEAFARPGRQVTQLARMPDGRTYLWIARTVSHGVGGYGTPEKTFSVALGCDVKHAGRLVYSKGFDLLDPEAPTPIGVGCKVCERSGCPQRAFPPIGKALAIDENASRFAPYRTS